MSAETDEFLQGLYDYQEAGADAPYVDWTNGFEATADEYAAYSEGEGDAEPAAGGWWGWEKD